MPRSLRVTDGGVFYHVLNRANARMTLFDCREDYDCLLNILAAVHDRVRMRTIGFCIMPNHWHLLLWPRGDGDLSEFMRLLTVTHTQRWHAAHGTTGTGHVYQGRYKSFPIQQTRPSAQQRLLGVLDGGDAILSVLRYIERNPLNAGLVESADQWPYSSLQARMNTDAVISQIPLTGPPVALPEDWMELVNQPQSEKELLALQRSIQRGSPYGRQQWVKQSVEKWNLQNTLRPRGRPSKGS